MKTRPVIVSNPYQHLSPVQRTLRILAIMVVFAGVFVWFFKILFF
jgi:hypothetical protein